MAEVRLTVEKPILIFIVAGIYQNNPALSTRRRKMASIRPLRRTIEILVLANQRLYYDTADAHERSSAHRVLR